MPRGRSKKGLPPDHQPGTPSPASDKGDADIDWTQFITETESFLETRPDRKAAFEAAFGSMDAALAHIRKDDPQWVQKIIREIQRSLDSTDRGCLTRINQISRLLADVPRWKALAASDPGEFRRQQDSLLSEYKATIRTLCRIKSHRPRNEAQNAAILEIKESKPDWSFGQVAREYTRRTRKPMTAKVAERTYTRAKPDAEAVLLDLPSSFLPLFKNLQNTTKA